MAKKQTKKSNMKTSTKIEAALTLGAVAAIAAGTYFLYGSKDAPKRRKQIQGWMLKMKGEVLEKIENLKDVNEETYNAIVDDVSKKYKKMKKVDAEELLVIAADLKKHWLKIKKDVEQARKELEADLPKSKPARGKKTTASKK